MNQWFAEGVVAGNIGDFYDNRDGGHSPFEVSVYPQLQTVEYSAEERSRRVGWGAQTRLLPMVVIGNSSTSATVDKGGCIARLAYYSRAGGLDFLYGQYRANNLYVYPEHHDHDAGHNGTPGYGDLLPTNTPYLVLSQGSSGSDRVFLKAFFRTLASFHPQVKQALVRAGLLMPTLQMIFRYSNQGVQHDGEYLTGRAHPTAFSGKRLASGFMEKMARDMRLADVPPLVQLEVVEEDTARNGVDFFEAGNASERLADTPAVIARVFRRTAYSKRMVVSAAGSQDLNQRHLSYHWVVLRGDAQRIQINPQGDGATAEIIVPFHERQPVWEGAALESNRVDIGVFVHNGVYFSAPGFITFHFLDNEGRTYDAVGRIREVFYNAGDTDIRVPLRQNSVSRWQVFFAIMDKPDNDVSGFLLERQFDRAEMAVLGQAGAEFAAQYKRYTLARAAHESAKHKKRQLEKERAATDKRLAEARKQQAPETATIQAQRDSLKRAVDAAHKENHASYKEQSAAQVAMLELINKERPAIGHSVARLVERALNAINQNPQIYPLCADAIRRQKWARGQKDGQTQLTGQVRHMVALGILAEKAGGQYTLDTPEDQLGRYGRYMVGRLNFILLTRFLYAGFLEPRQIDNYVDPRLTVPKAWRDVYQYDATGRGTGWIRYEGRDHKTYNAAGQLLGNGRAQTVYYSMGPSKKLEARPITNSDSPFSR